MWDEYEIENLDSLLDRAQAQLKLRLLSKEKPVSPAKEENE